MYLFRNNSTELFNFGNAQDPKVEPKTFDKRRRKERKVAYFIRCMRFSGDSNFDSYTMLIDERINQK